MSLGSLVVAPAVDRSAEPTESEATATSPLCCTAPSGAPYADDVATRSKAAAVERDVCFKARLEAGERPYRVSSVVPGTEGALAVTTASTYWATADGGSVGVGSCARACGAACQKATATKARRMAVRPRTLGRIGIAIRSAE
jgi:hypothetical protein